MGRERSELIDLLSLLQDWRSNSNGCDKVKWNLASDGRFSVQQLKALIKEKIEVTENGVVKTRWSKAIPTKIAVLIWRARCGRLPSREMLDKMGIELNSTLCPRCSSEVETVNHAIVTCEEVNKIWKAVAS